MHTVVIALHFLAAAVWVGGTIALVFAAVPVLRRASLPERPDLMRGLGRRWRPLGYGALVVLGLTGVAAAEEHYAFEPAVLLETAFGIVLLVKSGLVVLLVAGAILHDYVLGPRLQDQVRGGRPQTVRPWLVGVGWTNFVLTLVVPLLGVWLTAEAHGF